MTLIKHVDEARRDAIASLRALLETEPAIERACLLDDLFGRVHVVLWLKGTAGQELQERVESALQQAAGHFWSGDLKVATQSPSYSDKLLFDSVWSDGQPDREMPLRLHIADRYRTRGGWFTPMGEPPWRYKDAPPSYVVTFYSFKGGMGRTTALAAFAIARAREEERVVVLDLDLDAPGAGPLLAADERGTTAQWGVVDYLLEQPQDGQELSDYYHACRRAQVTGAGELLVFPAGRVGPDYLGKLARVDFEPPPPHGEEGLRALLHRIRQELAPRWILLDSRAGLGDPASLALSGVAHLHVLLGTTSEQSWQGLGVVIDRLGAERLHAGRAQAECILVQSMVPVESSSYKTATEAFQARADEEFRGRYYAAERADDRQDEAILTVRDMHTRGAAHIATPMAYNPRLAHFNSIDEVADTLAADENYKRLGERILERFPTGEEE